MSTKVYRYLYLSPTLADQHIAKTDVSVWYYGTSSPAQNGVLGTSANTRPSDAFAAICITADDEFADGDELFAIELAGGKDPQQPPPPPQLNWSKTEYLQLPEVIEFSEGLARGLSKTA